MIIGLASPISSFFLKEYLDPQSAIIAKKLSDHDAPAVTNLALSFLKKGHKLIVFTKDPEATKFKILNGPSLKIYVVPNRIKGWRRFLGKMHLYDIMLLWRMFMASDKLDVLSVQWTRDYAIGARHFFGKCPVTCTVRDVLPVISKLQPIDKITLWQNEYTMNCKRYYFISNSEYTQEMVYKLWEQSSFVIHNGISEEFLEFQPKEKFPVFTLATITTAIDGRKNIEIMLRAFEIFHRNNSETQLLLIGPLFNDNNPKVIKWKNEGILNGVKLLGGKTRQEIKALLTQSHCLFHPALEETFGNILVEAMACKCLPIGGENSGAVPYVLHHGELGLLCDVTDVDSITAAMSKAYAGHFEEMIEAGFASVHTQYSPSTIADKYIQFFNTILKKQV